MSTTLTPYLAFNGNTREVFGFYEQALGAKIQTMMSYADMPKMPGPPKAAKAACRAATASCTPASCCPAARC